MKTGRTDLKSELKELYAPPPHPVLVDVPELSFLMIDGRADPNHIEEFGQAIEALFSVSYTLKFQIKSEDGVDYTVMPLEGLWWTTGASDGMDFSDKRGWSWTAMMCQAPVVTTRAVELAAKEASGRRDLPALAGMRLEAFREGLCAQVMHVGPHSDEGPTIEKLHAFIADQGFGLRGKHHEIYVGDPRRSAPERLRTVIRQPVAPLPLRGVG